MEAAFCMVSKDLPLYACKDVKIWYDLKVV